MNLYEQLQKDMISAMKNGEKDKLTVIRMVKGAMQLENINNKKELNDELLIDVVNKQIKLRNDSISEFEKASRTDLITKTKEEIAVLEKYLPVQLTSEEVLNIVNDIFAKVNPASSKDMGLIMKEITPLVKGKTDMKKLSEIIKNKLNEL